MNNLKLPPFYVGQKVVYITGKRMPKNSIHTITGIVKHDCGHFGVYINTKNFNWGPTIKYCKCEICGELSPVSPGSTKPWSTLSFRAIEEAKPPLMTFTQIKEKEKEEILILN